MNMPRLTIAALLALSTHAYAQTQAPAPAPAPEAAKDAAGKTDDSAAKDAKGERKGGHRGRHGTGTRKDHDRGRIN